MKKTVEYIHFNLGTHRRFDMMVQGPFDTFEQALFALLNVAYKRNIQIITEAEGRPIQPLDLRRWAFKSPKRGSPMGEYLAGYIFTIQIDE